MSPLAALAAYYDRLAARGEAPAPGYAPVLIGAEVVLSAKGDPIAFAPLGDPSAKRPGRVLDVPVVERTSGVKPAFLWDKTAYALGATAGEGKRIAAEHAAFVDYHLTNLPAGEDEGLDALRAFLTAWKPARYSELSWPQEMLDANIVFRLDGDTDDDGKRRFLHERPAARALWGKLRAPSEETGMCLVTGETGPIARLHPQIKNVMGAQSAGASLVSFNANAFVSYGFEDGANAPVSETAAFAYAAALNALLARDSGRRVRIGDATTVFWADAKDVDEKAAMAAEDELALLLGGDDDDPETREMPKICAALDAIAKGRATDIAPDLDPNTRVHILGLSPNNARLSVRFYHVDTFGELARRLSEHFEDLRLEPSAFKTAPSAFILLLETAMLRKAENIPPLIGGELMRAILTGQRYPQTLLSAVVGRIRADKDINGARTALCKAVINRDARKRKTTEEDSIPVALDRDNPSPAYRLGRLFRLLERAQELALPGINATIRDRYLGAASATPARVFPLLISGANHHLAQLRKSDKPGLGHWLEREIGEVWSGLEPDLPRILSLEDQGRFHAGYYHQRFARADKAGAENPIADEPAPATQEEE